MVLTLRNNLGSTLDVNKTEDMPSEGKHGAYWGTGSTGAATGMWQGLISASAVGTGAFQNLNISSAGVKARSATGTTINSIIGHRVSSLHTERDMNPRVEFKVSYPTAVTTMRAYLGYTSSASAPASAADPLANLKGVGFWYDSAVDTEWMIAQNDGSASSDITTIVNIATAGTAVHTYGIRADNAASKFEYSYDGGAWTTVNTKIPAATDTLTVHWYIECLAGTASRTIDVYWVQGWQSG